MEFHVRVAMQGTRFVVSRMRFDLLRSFNSFRAQSFSLYQPTFNPVDATNAALSNTTLSQISDSSRPPSSSLFLQQFGHHLDFRDEKHSLCVILPDSDANLLGIIARNLVLLEAGKVLEEVARRGRHPLVFNLPEADLVDDCGR
jgi:hypothetical protein